VVCLRGESLASEHADGHEELSMGGAFCTPAVLAKHRWNPSEPDERMVAEGGGPHAAGLYIKKVHVCFTVAIRFTLHFQSRIMLRCEAELDREHPGRHFHLDPRQSRHLRRQPWERDLPKTG
jgi:hypothetical protein